jgi:hypothetical protein
MPLAHKIFKSAALAALIEKQMIAAQAIAVVLAINNLPVTARSLWLVIAVWGAKLELVATGAKARDFRF